MISQDAIIIVTKEPETGRAVADAIGGTDDRVDPEVCHDLQEMVATLERSGAQAALIDIDPAPDRMLSELDAIIGRFASTRFIVIASELRKQWLLQAMQSGARNFLTKAEIGTDLLPVITRLAPTRPTSNGSMGTAVTVLSAGGGSGSTTLAVNMACELHAMTSATLLIDLDRWYGTAAGHVGLRNVTYGVADVLAARDRLDVQLVRSSAVTRDDGLAVLASPAAVNPTDPAELDLSGLDRVMETARAAYRHVVVDAPRLPLAAAESLARASARTFIVFEINVEDIRVARAMYAGLTGRGIPENRIVPVVNRYRTRRQAITLDEVRKALGTARVACLSNDYQTVLQSINFGKTLRESAPRSDIRREIQSLAQEIQERTGAAMALTR